MWWFPYKFRIWTLSVCSKMLSKALLLGVLLLTSMPLVAIERHEMHITRAQWPTHVNGNSVLTLPAIEQTLRLFAENGKFNIIIRYPGGDAGRRWATELHHWLISFGVPTKYLETELGSAAADQLDIHGIDRS